MHILIKFAFRAFLFVIASIYVVLSPAVAMPVYKCLLFPAPKYPVGNYNVELIPDCPQKDVYFYNSDGNKLHGRKYKKPDTDKWILYSHGNGANISYLKETTRLLMDDGASVFLYDYRGYGRSEGTPSLPGICEDARAAFDYLVNTENADPAKIVLYGESLGTGVSAHLARSRKCGGIILHGPYLSIRAAGEELLPILRLYPNWLFPIPNLSTVEPLKNNRVPLLIVHGAKDMIIRVHHGKELFDMAGGPKQLLIVKNAVHWNSPFVETEEFQKQVSKIIKGIDHPQKNIVSSSDSDVRLIVRSDG